MLVPVHSSQTQIEVKDESFNRAFNATVVHELLVSYRATARSGSHQQKNRSDVRGGGKKPWRQKGTGRARAGTSRSPLWRGGGVTFAKRPRDYALKVNRKAYSVALQCIFSQLLREDRLVVIENEVLQLPQPRVASFRDAFGGLYERIENKLVLVIASEIPVNFVLGSRNLRHICVQRLAGLDPLSLVRADITLVSREALASLNDGWQV